MYDSAPRDRDGEPLEEVLPAAIRATATSEKDRTATARRRLSRERTGRELVPKASQEEPGMRVMKAGSPVLSVPGLSRGLVIGAGAGVIALALLVMILL